VSDYRANQTSAPLSGAQYGASPKTVLACGIWPVSLGGDDNAYPIFFNALGQLQVSASVTVTGTSRPQHSQYFQASPNGSAVVVVPANPTTGQGKTIVNASISGGAAGVDVWLGKDNTVTAGNGHYLAPGAYQSYSGQEAVWAYAASTALVTAVEEQT